MLAMAVAVVRLSWPEHLHPVLTLSRLAQQQPGTRSRGQLVHMLRIPSDISKSLSARTNELLDCF